ncbi:hypothetical protein ACFL46_03615 [Candidatus Neomarinimicrobiota bacterium]
MKLTNQKTAIILIAIILVIGMFLRSLGKSAGPLSKKTQSLIFDSQTLKFSKDIIQNEQMSAIEETIISAASYLVQQNQSSGRFYYRINTNPQVKISKRYNILRHAGTLYALASYAKRYGDSQTRESILRGSQFLKTQLRNIQHNEPVLAVFSDPIINGSDDSIQAKLGGTGLGLVALCSAESLSPRSTSLDTLKMMGNFIRYMQKDDGSFYSKYFPDRQKRRDDSWTSLYYPGEAVLGLLMLYEIDPDPIWLESAKKGLLFLARARENKSRVPADHWALIASDHLLKIDREINISDKNYIVNHLLQIIENIITNNPNHPLDHLFFGCLSNDGRTTPTATRLEGLLAALPYIKDYNPEKIKEAVTTIDNGIGFLIKSQIKSGKYMGGIPRAIKALDSDHPGYSKTFNHRYSEIRIDYVQHALSALIAYHSLLN